MGAYVVTAPLVQVETTERHFVQVAKGAEVPSNVTKTALENLIDLGYVEKVKAKAASASTSASTPAASGEAARPTSVEAILAEVGDDVEKAKVALEAEKAGKARKTLVDPLEAMIAAAEGQGGGN